MTIYWLIIDYVCYRPVWTCWHFDHLSYKPASFWAYKKSVWWFLEKYSFGVSRLTGYIGRFIFSDLLSQLRWSVHGHVVRTKSGLLERRWGVGGEVKAERNVLSLLLCLVCGNCPSYGYCRMLSLCLVRSIHSKATGVFVVVYVCALRVPLLTCSGTLTYVCVRVCPVCLCGPWLTHLCCYRRSKPDVTLDWSAGRGIQVGTRERVEQIERDRARGQRRSTRWSEALSHQLALWPRSQSLSFFSSSFHSFHHSLIPSLAVFVFS